MSTTTFCSQDWVENGSKQVRSHPQLNLVYTLYHIIIPLSSKLQHKYCIIIDYSLYMWYNVHMTDTVNKITLVIQEVTTKDKQLVDVVFGTILLNPKDKKSKKGEMINFHTLLKQTPSFEKHIVKMIKEALELKQKQDETNKKTNDTKKDVTKTKVSKSKSKSKSK